MRAAAALALVACLPACSVARHRYDGTIRTPSQRLDVVIRVDAGYGEQPYNFITDGLLFPIDAVISLLASIAAVDDDRVDIAAGPGGMLLAMLLPCVTATYDQGLATLEALETNRPETLRDNYRALLSTTDAALQAWSRGEMTLRDALLAGTPDGALKGWLRSGRAEVTPAGPLQRR
jgi:hypothetical protein